MEDQQEKHEEFVLKDASKRPLLISTHSRRLVRICYGSASVSESVAPVPFPMKNCQKLYA